MEKFAEAWLASNMPDGVSGEWIAKNCELVEVRGTNNWTYFYKPRTAAVLTETEFEQIWDYCRDYSVDWNDMKRLFKAELFSQWSESHTPTAPSEGDEA